MTTTRRQFTCALAGGLSVAAAGCSVAQQTASVRAIDVHGQLSTKDGKVVDQNGAALSLAGPSLFWHNLGWSDRGGLEPGDYYNPAVVRSALRLWNAPIIRAAIGVETNGGYIQHPDYAWSRLTAVVDAAIDNGMYCIVDWHTHHAEDHAPVAHAFFTRVAKRYAGYPNVIYELYNEPLPTANWSRVIRPYAADLMETIRAIDADNLIVVGTRSWSQDVDEAAKEPLPSDSALAYTLHFYAGTHRDSLRDKARAAIDTGLPLLVTEWGAIEANGDGVADLAETERWMAFLRKHQLTHCNWSLHSKGEGASILRPHTPADGNWTASDLTATGRLTTGIMRTWHDRQYG